MTVISEAEVALCKRVEARAREYVRTYVPSRELEPAAGIRVDPAYCTAVASAYHAMAHEPSNPAIRAEFSAFKAETQLQYEYILEAGINVLPWQSGKRTGGRYASTIELRQKVARSSTIYVYLTDHGYGPEEIRQLNGSNHPMLEFSDYLVHGVQLRYNDLYRVVHDVFGHMMYDYDLGLEGEIGALFVHMQMYSTVARRALFAESLAQVCCYHFGGEPDPAEGEPASRQGGSRAAAQAAMSTSAPTHAEVYPRHRFPAQKAGLFPIDLVDGCERLRAGGAARLPV